MQYVSHSPKALYQYSYHGVKICVTFTFFFLVYVNNLRHCEVVTKLWLIDYVEKLTRLRQVGIKKVK